jgi:hypothetical protein
MRSGIVSLVYLVVGVVMASSHHSSRTQAPSSRMLTARAEPSQHADSVRV